MSVARALVAELAADPETLRDLAAALREHLAEPDTGGAVEQGDGYLAPAAAAAYLGVNRKRIYDLKSMGALEPDGYDGRTPLFTRETLDDYVRAAMRGTTTTTTT